MAFFVGRFDLSEKSQRRMRTSINNFYLHRMSARRILYTLKRGDAAQSRMTFGNFRLGRLIDRESCLLYQEGRLRSHGALTRQG